MQFYAVWLPVEWSGLIYYDLTSWKWQKKNNHIFQSLCYVVLKINQTTSFYELTRKTIPLCLLNFRLSSSTHPRQSSSSFHPPASSLKVKQKLIICLELQRAPAPHLLFPTLDLLASPLVRPARTHLFKWQRKRLGWCHDIILRQIVLQSLWVFFFFFKGGVFHPELHRG